MTALESAESNEEENKKMVPLIYSQGSNYLEGKNAEKIDKIEKSTTPFDSLTTSKFEMIRIENLPI